MLFVDCFKLSSMSSLKYSLFFKVYEKFYVYISLWLFENRIMMITAVARIVCY